MRRPLVAICVFFILGILSARFIHFSLLSLSVLTIISFFSSLLFLKLNFRFNFFIFISFFLLGACLFKNSQILPSNHIQKYIGEKSKYVILRGVINSDPKIKYSNYGKKSTFIFNVKEIKSNNNQLKGICGKILVISFQQQQFFYGQELILEGKIYKVPKFAISEKFNYQEYLKRRQIFGVLSVKKNSPIEIVGNNSGNLIKALSFKTKNRLKMQIVNHLPLIESSLLGAILLGERQDIPQFIKEIFIRTGTIHILAISGLHIGIIAFIILLFLKVIHIPRKFRYIITMLFLILYIFITGGRISVIRATIMFIVFLGGFIFERESDILNSLALACLLILAFNPNQLFDIGFQLSFVSVASIAIFSPKIEGYTYKILPKRNRIIFFLWRSLSVSLAVWLGVLGFIVYNFNIITPITIFANLFIIPLMLVVIALGLCFIVISLVLPTVCFVFANSSAASLFVLVKITYLLSKLPAAYFYIPPLSLYLIFIYYFLLLAFFNLPFIVRLIHLRLVAE